MDNIKLVTSNATASFVPHIVFLCRCVTRHKFVDRISKYVLIKVYLILQGFITDSTDESKKLVGSNDIAHDCQRTPGLLYDLWSKYVVENRSFLKYVVDFLP